MTTGTTTAPTTQRTAPERHPNRTRSSRLPLLLIIPTLVAGTAVTLTDDEARLVEACYQPHPVLGIE